MEGSNKAELSEQDCYKIGAKQAQQCLAIYNIAMKLSLIILSNDMIASNAYDHNAPKGYYGEKNQYFNRANDICMPFLQLGLTGISKIIYWKMLNTINVFRENEKIAKQRNGLR